MGRKVPVVAVNNSGGVAGYYSSIAEAARVNGFSESSIHHAIASGGTSYRLKWMKEEDYRKIWEEGRTDELKYSYKQMNSDRARRSWSSASSKKRSERIANISKSRKKLVSEHPEVMAEAIKAHKQPVMCVSTGECFDSIKAFADRYGLNRISVTVAIRNGHRTGGLIVNKITKEEYEIYQKGRHQEEDWRNPA